MSCLPKIASLPSGLVARVMAFTVLLAGAAGFAANARADNVYWSVGVASPGVSIGVSSGWPGPVYVQSAPVYVRPAPVWVQPMPVAPVYYQAVPFYQPGWAPPGRALGWHRKHGHLHGYQHGHESPHAGHHR